MDTGKKSLCGYLRITCQADAAGRSTLARKEFRTPIHISKPYWDGQNLLLNVMSPTAGVFSGDEVDIDVSVRENASLILSSPSSIRAHKMDTGYARWDQNFTVAAGGFLETNPEWLILQAESDFRQSTSLQVDKGGELLFIETLAPGRIAHGESFAFRRFRNRFTLRYNHQWAAIERFEIEPAKETHLSWKNAADSPFYASLFCISEKLLADEPFWTRIHNLQTNDLKIGSSALATGPCWNIKLIASNPADGRKTIAAIRELFYNAVGRQLTKLRR